MTSALTPAGRPYLDLGGWLPLSFRQIVLTFSKTGAGAFAPTYQIYDGLGSR